MTRLLLIVFFFGLGCFARGELSFSLIPPTASVAPGATVEVELVAFNRGAEAVHWDRTPLLHMTAKAGLRSWPVELRTDDTASGTIAAGGFMARRYTFVMPAEALGGVVLERADPAALGVPPIVIEVVSEGGLLTGPVARPEVSVPVVQPSASRLERTFAGRLSANEPIYFIYGPDAPTAKFQFSFKYRLLSFGKKGAGASPDTLQMGFTQRSLWDIDASSSPFYDTSYMPEIIFESFSLERVIGGGVTFLGFQVGYKHESNGRDGPISRSLNTVYLRPAVLLGTLDGWHMLIIPEVFEYVGSLSDNARLKHYRGHGQLRIVAGKNTGPSLLYTGMVGKGWEHFSTQLDLTVPVRTRILDFETYLLVQYFDGYGESLLSFDEHSRTVRAGISLVR